MLKGFQYSRTPFIIQPLVKNKTEIYKARKNHYIYPRRLSSTMQPINETSALTFFESRPKI